ncbi:MAG: FAD-binding protein [Candidatus Lokiarchaeota archaeon]|nr:FAD-binding protein [Candidatus Lokiarchaeota archaeon]
MIVKKLCKIVGEKYVSDGTAEKYIYAQDMTENEPCQPQVIVMPRSVVEVQAILEIANETKTPVVPFITGQNVGGLTIPQVEGAIVIDLKRMDKVLQIDEEAMYALVEPGVTFGHLRKHLDKHHPDLRYTYPLAPPYTSVVANALLQGLCDLSTRHGAMADFVNGLEVVLPTGEVVRVGSGILGEENWFGRYPLPDLVGLFSGWQGMTGIITKMALQLYLKPPYIEHAALFTFGEQNTTEILKNIARKQILDDADCMSLSLVKMLLGVEYPVEALKGEPDYATLIAVSGNTKIEALEKIRVIEEEVSNAQSNEPRHLLVTWDAITKLMGEQAQSWIDFPSDAFKILTEFDGLTWVGTYIHPKAWGQALAGGRKIVEKHGFELMAFLKPMNGMHFAEFKFIIRFPKNSEKIEQVKKCNSELLDYALDQGAIPYKTSVWAAKKLQERIDPQFIELLRKIKQTLDPNNIMNPGRWNL